MLRAVEPPKRAYRNQAPRFAATVSEVPHSDRLSVPRRPVTATPSLLIPDGFRERHPEEPGWERWVLNLPARVAAACAQFGLVVADTAALTGAEGVVVRCVTVDGGDAALKVGYGGWPWTAGEAAALAVMSPHAPQVLADDWPDQRVMVLEWMPGPRLADIDTTEERAEIAGLVASLTTVDRDYLPIPALAVLDRTVDNINPAEWAEAIEARYRRLGRPAHLAPHVADAADLANGIDTTGTHLVNLDVSFDNILQGTSGWKVIDPEPAWGPPAAAAGWPAAILARLGDPAPVHTLAAAAGLPATDVAAWAYIDSVTHALWYPPGAPHLWGHDPDRDHAGVACDTLRPLLDQASACR